MGTGSYGLVHVAKWRGVEVAVKRLIKQRLTEQRLLEFRAEVALLAELHHPNIVLFIGACVRSPNLCVVMELVKRGSLRAILSDVTIKLPWRQRLRMLHGAALAVTYLHSLKPVILHRDLKSSNLLVRLAALFLASDDVDVDADVGVDDGEAGGRGLDGEGGRLWVRADQGGERDDDPLRHALLDGARDHRRPPVQRKSRRVQVRTSPLR